MANSILKGIAIAAGTGLAMGVSSGRQNSPRSFSHPRTSEGDDVLYIEPLLDRLEDVESLLENIRQHQNSQQTKVPEHYASRMADLDRRVEQYGRDVALLREEAAAAERRSADTVAFLERKVREAREEIPVVVERSLTARLEEVRARFDAEMARSQQRTLEMFERAIDEKITSRIGAIEKRLDEQATSIEALQTRAAETDQNLQKLVSAIERLCERAQLVTPAPNPYAPAPYAPAAWSAPAFGSSPTGANVPVAPGAGQSNSGFSGPGQSNSGFAYDSRLPFEAQLHEALRNAGTRVAEAAAPVEKPIEAAPAMQLEAPSFGETKPKRSLFRFRSMIAFGLSLMGSRIFFR